MKTIFNSFVALTALVVLASRTWAEDPIVHYMFHYNLYDVTGNGYDGTLVGNAAYDPQYIDYITFNNPTGNVAATQYVRMPDLTSTLAGSDYTIAIRYKTTDTSGLNGRLYGNTWNGSGIDFNYNGANRPAPNGLIAQNDGGTQRWAMFGNFNSNGTPVTSDGQWHTAVLTVNREMQEAKFYVDGNNISTTFIPFTAPLHTSFANFTIGALGVSSGGENQAGAKASVDDFQILRGALNDAQVRNINFGFPTNADPNAQIRFSTPQQADAKRSQLVNWIFNGNLPTGTMPSVTKNVAYPTSDLNGVSQSLVASVDRIDANVGGTDFHAKSYLLHPTNTAHANKLLIVHQGHSTNTMDWSVRDSINAALQAGYTVNVMTMPLKGWNNDTTLTVDGVPYNLTMDDHNSVFTVLKNHGNDGLKFRLFVEPIVQNVNYWKSLSGAAGVAMTGISGGGWSTHMAAAIDPRINLSVPVAGSAPLYSRNLNGATFIGDAPEQYYTPLFGESINSSDMSGGGVATWQEIYALGGYGTGRKEVMVTNLYDDCCFNGTFADAFKNVVANKVSELGAGQWQYYADPHTASITNSDGYQSTHYISSDVMQNYVLANMNHLGNNTKIWVGATEPTASHQATSTAQAFGRIMQNAGPSATISLGITGSDASSTPVSVSTGGAATTTAPSQVPAVSSLGSITVGLNTSSNGPVSGTVTVQNLASDWNDPSQGSDNGAATINVTGTVLVQRGTAGSTLAATPVNLGLQHTGVNLTGTTFTTTVSTTGDDSHYTRVRVEGGSTPFDGTSGAGVNQTRSLAGPSNLTAGSGTLYNLAVSSAEDASTGDGSPYASIPVSYTAQVFNGSGTMSQNGSWGAHANWIDSNSVHAAPGTFAGFDNVDTAALPTGRATSLDGASPSVNALTLGGSVSLSQGSGGSLHLKGASAALTATGSGNTVSAPVSLDSDTTFAVNNASDTLSVAALSGSGNLTKTGTGTLTLSGANSFSGSLTVSAGAVQVTGSLANNGSNKVSLARDGNGLFGDGNGDVSLTRRVSSGASYSGIGSRTAAVGNDPATTADLLAGTAGSTHDVTMSWRGRATAELTRAGGGLISQILDLEGMATSGGQSYHGSHQTDTFVLQMSYDPSLMQQIWSIGEATAAAQGRLYLGYLDLGSDVTFGTADDHWTRAVDGNFGGISNYVGNHPYSAAYSALGSYGVDTTNHVVWAVLDHNSQFAAVPESSTFVLLSTGLISLLIHSWRKRRSFRSSPVCSGLDYAAEEV